MPVCLSVRLRISEITRLNFTKFYVHVGPVCHMAALGAKSAVSDCILLSTHADRRGVDISVTVRVFVFLYGYGFLC